MPQDEPGPIWYLARCDQSGAARLSAPPGGMGPSSTRTDSASPPPIRATLCTRFLYLFSCFSQEDICQGGSDVETKGLKLLNVLSE